MLVLSHASSELCRRESASLSLINTDTEYQASELKNEELDSPPERNHQGNTALGAPRPDGEGLPTRHVIRTEIKMNF